MFDTFSALQIAAIFLVYLGAATGKGITGIGFSTTCLPFLAYIVGLKEALALIIVPSIVSNVIVQVGAAEFTATVRRFWPMLLATLPGLAVGLILLDGVDGTTAAMILGAVLIAYCGFAFVRPDLRLRPGLERPLAPVSGFLTGTVNGLTGSQVWPSMPYLMSLGLSRDMFLQAINSSFTLSSVVMLFGLSRLGLVPAATIAVSVVGVAFAIGGVRVGERIRHRLSPERFRVGVLIMLTLLGVSLIVRGVI